MLSPSPLFSWQQCITLLCWLCYGLLISRWVRVTPSKSQLLLSLNSLVDLEGIDRCWSPQEVLAEPWDLVIVILREVRAVMAARLLGGPNERSLGVPWFCSGPGFISLLLCELAREGQDTKL